MSLHPAEFYGRPRAPRKMTQLSIVVPCHNELENVVRLYEAILEVQKQANWNFELIFVDDSTDRTPNIIADLHHRDSRVTLLKLTRSFGQSVAIFAGLRLASGDAAVVMDADLEDPPSAIPLMIQEWLNGYDVVLARRKRVGLKLSYRLFQKLYYWSSQAMSEVEIPSGVGEFRLLDRRVAEVLVEFGERAKFFRGLSLWPGFKNKIIDVQRNERVSGQSQYNFARATSVAIDGLISFSSVPLRVIALVGFTISGLTGLLSIGYLIWRLVDPHSFGEGWASLFLVSLFSTGLNLLFLGVVAEYVGRIFQQVQERPSFVVDHVLRAHEKPETISSKRPEL